MNGNSLKIWAIILMVLEHADVILSNLFHSETIGIAVHYTGRLVFPIFVFMMVEGFFKTSSREKYLKRVFIWAMIMSIGSFILIEIISRIYSIPTDNLYASPQKLFRFLAPIGKNILWSLGFGLLMIYCIERSKSNSGVKKIAIIFLAVLIGFITLMTEASYNVAPLFLLFYFFYNKKIYAYLGYALFSLLILLNGLQNIQNFWSFEYQWVMIFALPIFLIYNGKRGELNIKYLFYIVYPLHLWIIFWITHVYLK